MLGVISLSEGPRRRAEGLDEPGLVLLPKQPQYEALLTRLCRLVAPDDEDAGDEVDGQPLHQHVHHEDPRGDEEHTALQVMNGSDSSHCTQYLL